MNYIPLFYLALMGGTGAYLVKHILVLFCPRVAAGIRMASIFAGVFAFKISVYVIFFFLSPFASILVDSTLNAVDDFLSP